MEEVWYKIILLDEKPVDLNRYFFSTGKTIYPGVNPEFFFFFYVKCNISSDCVTTDI